MCLGSYSQGNLGFTVGLLPFRHPQADLEQALLQRERQGELERAEAEAQAVAQLQRRLSELDSAVQGEKEKVPCCLHSVDGGLLECVTLRSR